MLSLSHVAFRGRARHVSVVGVVSCKTLYSHSAIELHNSGWSAAPLLLARDGHRSTVVIVVIGT